MTQINKPPVTEQKPIEISRAMEAFLLNLHLFTPSQRERVLRLLEYLFLPKYVMHNSSPIEEEWINKNINKVIVSEEKGGE